MIKPVSIYTRLLIFITKINLPINPLNVLFIRQVRGSPERVRSSPQILTSGPGCVGGKRTRGDPGYT